MIVKLVISGYTHRMAMIQGLAVAGYKVWEESKEEYLRSEYRICFECKKEEIIEEIVEGEGE
jgi:hypothetical protein